MPAPTSVEEFVNLVRKSGLIEDSRVSTYIERLHQSAEPVSDPAAMAGHMVRDGLLTNYQSEQLLQGRWKRFIIGKYKVLERIGSGGMGQVFLCEHRMMRRRVAVKVLPAAKAADPASLERFYREARAVAALDHPNIVRAFDIDEDNGLHFIVMEYVDGLSLQELVKKVGPLDPVRAAHYVVGAAVGLQHAHEMGLVHRDIKPGNVLVDRHGVVKVLDMGLARFFNDTDDILTKKYDENVLGTADYLAPEQAFDSHAADIRADIYALGGTLYYMLTGQPPFVDGTVSQKILWHQTREPAPVRNLRPDCPPEIVAVLDRMMAKQPENRFQTPAEVVAAMAECVRTPVAPPTPEELPQLSLAAKMGGSQPRSVGPGSSIYVEASGSMVRSDPLRPVSPPSASAVIAPPTPPAPLFPTAAPTPPPTETAPFRPPALPQSPPIAPQPTEPPRTESIQSAPPEEPPQPVPTDPAKTTELWTPQLPRDEGRTGTFAGRLLSLLGVVTAFGLTALAIYLVLGRGR